MRKKYGIAAGVVGLFFLLVNEGNPDSVTLSTIVAGGGRECSDCGSGVCAGMC